jgi:DNA-binding response OmpR family regulator
MVQKGPTFLVADDEPAIRKVLARMLQNGFPGSSVIQVSQPDRIAKIAAIARPQLILVDWVFPGRISGASVCQKLKRHPQTRSIPIILMSGERKGLTDRVKSVVRGADLFPSKPVTSSELCGYVRALLERNKVLKQPLRIGPLTLSRSNRSGWWRGKPIPALTPKQFELLWLLAKKSPQPISHSDLVRQVWNNAVKDKHATLAVVRLRAKLSLFHGLAIDSVPGAGYRLTAE